VQLTMKEVNRLKVLEGYMDGTVTIEQASLILKCRARSVYRMVAKLRSKGPEGILHGNRNSVSPRRTPEVIREKILGFVRGKYSDINDTHLSEILREVEGIAISRETLRSILRGAGVGPKRKVRRRKYRSRRERKEAFGMMLQIDASDHDWLQGRGPRLTLVGCIDDATNRVWVRFEMSENTWGYIDLMREVFSTNGLPLSLYSDRHTIFHTAKEPTIIEQLKDVVPLTQFGRAMDELGIQIIKAWSPQAKGRIERQWGTLQDRLVVALRLAGAKTLEDANRVLEDVLPKYNRQFSIQPKQTVDVFRKPPCKTDLEKVLCLKETRVVKKDHTVSFEGLVLQIPPSRKYPCMADGVVDVRQYRDGHVDIAYRDTVVARFSSEAITRLLKIKSVSRNARKAA